MVGIDDKKILRVSRESEYGAVLNQTRMTVLEFGEWYGRLKESKARIIPNGVNGFIAITENRYFVIKVM